MLTESNRGILVCCRMPTPTPTPTETAGGGALAVLAGDVLVLRGAGLAAPETWALLCQAAQALQDLFLSSKYSLRRLFFILHRITSPGGSYILAP